MSPDDSGSAKAEAQGTCDAHTMHALSSNNKDDGFNKQLKVPSFQIQ